MKVSQGAVTGSVTGSSNWKCRREQSVVNCYREQLLSITGSRY